MTMEEAQALCFEDREVDYSNVKALPLEDLKYKVGDTVRLKSLKNIIAYNRASSCVYEDIGRIELTVDECVAFTRAIDTWDKPEVITEITCYNVNDVMVYYYIFDNGWADEYMIEDNKLKKLLDKVRYL